MINFELWNNNAPTCIITSINSLQAAWLKILDKKKVTWNTSTFNVMIFSIFCNQIRSFPRKWQTFFQDSTIHHASWRPPGRFLDYCRFLISLVQSTCAGIHIQPVKNISSGTFEKKSNFVKMCCIGNICCICEAHVLHMRHVLLMQHMLHMRSTGVAYATYVAYAKHMCCVCNVCCICEVH